MSKGVIPQEARTELEKGDIPTAVKLTAARNPDCSRLEICALLGEAIMDNPPAAIPLAAPLRWDQETERVKNSTLKTSRYSESLRIAYEMTVALVSGNRTR